MKKIIRYLFVLRLMLRLFYILLSFHPLSLPFDTSFKYCCKEVTPQMPSFHLYYSTLTAANIQGMQPGAVCTCYNHQLVVGRTHAVCCIICPGMQQHSSQTKLQPRPWDCASGLLHARQELLCAPSVRAARPLSIDSISTQSQPLAPSALVSTDLALCAAQSH
jgi:hypothetical protein